MYNSSSQIGVKLSAMNAQLSVTEISHESAGTAASPTFWVRDIPVFGDAILAPMDGYSDWPFRSTCRSLGSAMSYSEFVKVEDVLQRPRHIRAKLYYEQAERPVVFQIYGDDPDQILRAALIVQELGPDIIDINMGCPAKSVAARGAGVGMMRTPLKIARTFRKLVAALKVPVTGKIRLGWDDMRTYKLVARIVEENGGSLIAIHGRTKEQSYGGQADWDAIAEVKAAVKIPVVGNGDVKTVLDIQRLKSHTGCEAVMIGRAAIANPWIFSSLDREQVPPEYVRLIVRQHLERNIKFYGPEDGQRLFRKHAVQYLLMRQLSRDDRKKILQARPPAEFMALLDQIYIPAAV
jgi:tRNA-dihydrouridine synthase B